MFSPQGRLHQVEYALEAVKQGSAAVGLKSNTHAILLALKVGHSSLEELGSSIPDDDVDACSSWLIVAFDWRIGIIPTEDVPDR